MTYHAYRKESTARRAVRGGLLAGLLLAATAPAQASVQPSLPGNWLYLSVTRGDHLVSDTSGTLLMCNPPQGHTLAAEACGQLASAGGDIGNIPRAAASCPMLHAPVTAHARGQWSGRSVEFRKTFSNDCELKGSTGAVFELDD
ncbi:SSI family serine proteinase inhibitor [Streptomyces sp. NPDC088789]|uniref:SSI family serine proteinase inhibitor n=1 Tax=Streptomyces sp. NPDC088789 TaxID=3365899 RepID=UPI00380BA63E